MARYWCVLLWLMSGWTAAAAPAKNLIYQDLDGVARRPLEAGAKLGVVLIFYLHDCPICNSYAPEINRLSASQTNFSFYVVQVDPELDREAARQHAQTYHLQVPVLLDPDRQLVKVTRAKVTPEVVVLGRDGSVRYQGRIDDRYPALGKHRATASQRDLQDALEAISAGKTVKPKRTKPVGCLIE